MKCSICQILQSGQDEEILLQSDHWRVVLAPDQAYLGRSYVTLLEHRSSLADLSSNQWLDLQLVIQTYEEMMLMALDSTLCNWVCLMNNAVRDGEETHVHWHVRPRHAGLVVLGGMEFRDPNYGHHYDSAAHRMVTRAELALIGRTLRS